MDLVTLADVKRARTRIGEYVHTTPVLSSQQLNDFLGGHQVFFKAECLQKVGAFKARGACNALRWLQEQARSQDLPINRVICNSSGNHAQAIAWAAGALGIPATIYMPTNVSKVKAQATKAYGADIVYCATRKEADEQVAASARTSGVWWIPPFNHPQVIAGQGTACLEAYEQLDALNHQPEAIFAPCGGGGLLSGTWACSNGLAPGTAVFGVEPLLGNDAANSLRQGKIVTLPEQPKTLADGTMTLAVGDITFAHLQQISGIYEVAEPVIAYWTQWLSHLLKLHLEPTCAMPMAAAAHYLSKQTSRTTVLVIISGGNVDQASMAKVWATDYLTTPPTISNLKNAGLWTSAPAQSVEHTNSSSQSH